MGYTTNYERERKILSFKATEDAIAAITELIHTKLSEKLIRPVDLGFPKKTPENRNYLILLEVQYDKALRSELGIKPGGLHPVWLNLRYLLLAYGTHRINYDPYKDIGRAIRLLQSLNYVAPTNVALEKNPEPIRIGLDQAPLDQISKILGSVGAGYQISICFHVRPVMITLDEQTSEGSDEDSL